MGIRKHIADIVEEKKHLKNEKKNMGFNKMILCPSPRKSKDFKKSLFKLLKK